MCRLTETSGHRSLARHCDRLPSALRGPLAWDPNRRSAYARFRTYVLWLVSPYRECPHHTGSPHVDGFHILPGRTLKPLLATTFAITTPLGIGIGLATLGGVKTKGRACLPSLPPSLSLSLFRVLFIT